MENQEVKVEPGQPLRLLNSSGILLLSGREVIGIRNYSEHAVDRLSWQLGAAGVTEGTEFKDDSKAFVLRNWEEGADTWEAGSGGAGYADLLSLQVRRTPAQKHGVRHLSGHHRCTLCDSDINSSSHWNVTDVSKELDLHTD